MQEYSNNPTYPEGDAYDPSYAPSRREEPATAKQKLTITRLCMALGIREPIEEEAMTIGEAGRLIRELQSKRGKGG